MRPPVASLICFLSLVICSAHGVPLGATVAIFMVNSASSARARPMKNEEVAAAEPATNARRLAERRRAIMVVSDCGASAGSEQVVLLLHQLARLLLLDDGLGHDVRDHVVGRLEHLFEQTIEGGLVLLLHGELLGPQHFRAHELRLDLERLAEVLLRLAEVSAREAGRDRIERAEVAMRPAV